MLRRTTPPTLSAKEMALQLLSRRDHGQYELEQKLLQKGYAEEDTQQALGFCLERAYLDDLRFAKSQIRQQVTKGYGERRIRQELSQKRVAEVIIEQALAEEPQDWFELACLTAQKKFKGFTASDPKAYAKQVRFLQYRGYSFEQINYALKEHLND